MQRFQSRLGEALIKRLIYSREEQLDWYTELVLLAVIWYIAETLTCRYRRFYVSRAQPRQSDRTWYGQ
jgi:hypothetical protein